MTLKKHILREQTLPTRGIAPPFPHSAKPPSPRALFQVCACHALRDVTTIAGEQFVVKRIAAFRESVSREATGIMRKTTVHIVDNNSPHATAIRVASITTTGNSHVSQGQKRTPSQNVSLTMCYPCGVCCTNREYLPRPTTCSLSFENAAASPFLVPRPINSKV